MDLATLTGLLLGLLIVGVPLALTGTPLSTWMHPEALLIVLGGSMTATLVHYSLEDIQEMLEALRVALTEPAQYASDTAHIVADAASFIRARGLLAVQPLLSSLEEPLIRKGLQMIIDHQHVGDIEHKLSIDMEGLYLRQLKYSQILEFAGGVAPTMGILGAIVGLIHVSGLLTSPEQMGQGIASAFTATLYGVGVSNLVILPLAGKLRQRADRQWRCHCMILDGLLSIARKDNPVVTREKIQAYLAYESDGMDQLIPKRAIRPRATKPSKDLVPLG